MTMLENKLAHFYSRSKVADGDIAASSRALRGYRASGTRRAGMTPEEICGVYDRLFAQHARVYIS